MARGILKWVVRILKTALLLIFSYVLFNYLTCPVYDFPEPRPFSGDHYYNPYKGLDSSHWRRANFQIQSYAWWGITGGSYNTNPAIDSIYKMLGYDIIATSDYMKINRYGSEKKEYIPVYEHGYGTRKFHQVVIGASKVSWRDYPLFQNIHHKQHIIDLLKSKNQLVYIAHPKLRYGYSPDDFVKLTGYDGIEVLNYMRFSIEHWDAALAAGRYVTILGNDDAHDIRQPLEVGHRCTYIYTEQLDRESIIHALQEGKAFGADIYRNAEETYEQKAEKAKHIARLNRVAINGDTVEVEVSSPALEFRFIGSEGKILKRSGGSNLATYIIRPEDSYVRVEVTFPDKNIFYLNPIARYDGGDKPGVTETARVDMVRSVAFWIVSWSVVIMILVFYLRKRIRRYRAR